jgi:phosphoribosyl-dephospho-CoA transferase
MVPELRTHTLIRIRGPQALATAPGSDLPDWAAESLRRTPWVVIRRAPMHGGLLPIGVRGESRQQRFAAWLTPDEVLEYVTPQGLVSTRTWTRAAAAYAERHCAIPALAVRNTLERILGENGLAKLWGPGGSVGFELATGKATVTASSDLDLVVEIAQSDLRASNFQALWSGLTALPVRVDVLLETPRGAVALSEYAQVLEGPKHPSFVLRTPTGPRLIDSIAGL